MRPIRWLHISDVHMRLCDAWSQDVVLNAMCAHIGQQARDGAPADFIIATGDLAFSGRAEEYRQVASFLDALSAASGVPKERIFCIPGNHDIERDRQRLCFLGARTFLQDENRADEILAPGEDLKTLLLREESFRSFLSSYFIGQERTGADDGMGYVARLMIDDVRLAIVGLDSAWLAEGGVQDHGRLLIGERQVINTIRLAQHCDDPPHIVIAMAHHPLHLLQDFDRRPVQNRIETACQFFHCGHLHEPEVRSAGLSASGCLKLSAGASFETRQSENTYTAVTLDLLRAVRIVTTTRYNPSNGTFFPPSPEQYAIDVTPAGVCTVTELAQAMMAYDTALRPWAHYLAALLLDQKSELPIPTLNGHTFASFAVLQAQPDGDVKRKTAGFMAFRNALRVLYKRLSLTEILRRHGSMVTDYATTLKALTDVQARLAEQERDAQMLASTEKSESVSHSSMLLDELASAHEWEDLRLHARRHVNSPDRGVAIHAKRMLALGLANATNAPDRAAAIDLYRSLMESDGARATDAGNLATLLMEGGSFDEAKAAVLAGIAKSPMDQLDYLLQIAQRIVEAVGDRAFRRQTEAAIAARHNRG